ncbi:hypothetical protein PR048_020774 [Dryococelus australis]|uniref:Integrase catalytic domain-containing protein n=1 Tax=Dryococelus australis TaxID=614101 RepID=A0ABQ9GWE2_9NEOP|nr:hypothetical protein PR048_020774 [Dryococelus australis]
MQKKYLKDLLFDGEFCEGCIKGNVHDSSLNDGKERRKWARVYILMCVAHSLPRKGVLIFGKLKEFLTEAGVLGHKVMCIQCDNGGEFNNESLQSFLKTKGIEIRYTMPYSPQQNRCAERENITIVETVRTLMHSGEESLSKELWAEMIHSAAYILN